MQFRHSYGGGGFAWKDIMYKNEGKGIVPDDPQQLCLPAQHLFLIG